MKRFYYVIDGETPAKKNSRIFLRNGRNIPSKRFMDWHEVSMLQMNKQAKPESTISSPVEISMIFTHGDCVRRDSDNQCSSIMDLLTDAKILTDDCWKIVRSLRILNDYCKGKAFCCIEIKVLDETKMEIFTRYLNGIKTRFLLKFFSLEKHFTSPNLCNLNYKSNAVVKKI